MTSDRTQSTAQGRNDPQTSSTEARRAEARARAQKDGHQRVVDHESHTHSGGSEVELPARPAASRTSGDSAGGERR